MAAFSSFALAATIAGGALKTYGNIKANQAQAEAERANAAFYQEQAQFARESTARALEIYQDDAEDFRGKQVGAIAAGGLQMTGSALAILADTELKKVRESDAIIRDGKFKEREAFLKAGASIEQAERLSGFTANVLPAISTAAEVGVSIYKGTVDNAKN